jgi:hypothetical protein
LTTYLESDDDINKHIAQKIVHDEIVEVCSSILKELHSRTFQLKEFIKEGTAWVAMSSLVNLLMIICSLELEEGLLL